MKFNLFIAAAVLALFSTGSVAQNQDGVIGDQIPSLKGAAVCNNRAFVPSDGTQNPNKAGDKVCVSTPIGQLPSVNQMVSCIITNPRNGQVIKRNQPFTVDIKLANLETGLFSDPNFDYYDLPQELNAQGQVKGHSHITIQRLNGNSVPDAKVFAFFKGLNGKAKGGVLSQLVENGLPQRGTHRICTMNSANTHQCVVMPVAQRGAQDDCIRVQVV